MWSDNAKRAHSNASSSSTVLRDESRSYELKSEFDPCPQGWRVPSYYGRVTTNNSLALFGRKNNGGNDDLNYSYIKAEEDNVMLSGIKVYPGLGMDFTNAQNGYRNIGKIPVTGAYVYYPNSVSPNAPVGIVYQDNYAVGAYWSATYAYDGARLFSIITDPYSTATKDGLNRVLINLTNPPRTGNAVRCMKDPNVGLIGNFATQYFLK